MTNVAFWPTLPLATLDLFIINRMHPFVSRRWLGAPRFKPIRRRKNKKRHHKLTRSKRDHSSSLSYVIAKSLYCDVIYKTSFHSPSSLCRLILPLSVFSTITPANIIPCCLHFLAPSTGMFFVAWGAYSDAITRNNNGRRREVIIWNVY